MTRTDPQCALQGGVLGVVVSFDEGWKVERVQYLVERGSGCSLRG